jgi:hypothetical protein
MRMTPGRRSPTSTSRIGLAVVALAATVVAAIFAVLYFTNGSGDDTAVAAQCADSMYGHISSLTSRDDGFELRFDPAWFTLGVTANEAAAEDGVVEPGEPVPNDYYRIEEGHRLLTYVVPADAKVTVLTNDGTGILSTPITVSELARLVAGEKPVELFEQLESGIRLGLDGDEVCTIDQQYVP